MSGQKEVQGTQKQEENNEESRLTIGFVGRPQVYIEEPRRLPVPIIVNQYARKPTTVQIFQKQTPWGAKNTCLSPPKKRLKFFPWCRRRKRFKTEKINEIVRVGRQRREILHEVEMRQRSESLPPVIIKEKHRAKVRSVSVKPNTKSRYASVKKYNRKLPLAERFVNCVYRVCCQFYCYLTCVLIVVVVVLFVL